MVEIMDEIESKMGNDMAKNRFRHELKLMCYPLLSLVEEGFRGCVRDIGLPKDITVFHPPFLRVDHIEIRMKVESAEALSRMPFHLSSALENGKIDDLINIVKEGSP